MWAIAVEQPMCCCLFVFPNETIGSLNLVHFVTVKCANHGELTPFEWFLPYEGDGGLREYLLPFLESVTSCTR